MLDLQFSQCYQCFLLTRYFHCDKPLLNSINNWMILPSTSCNITWKLISPAGYRPIILYLLYPQSSRMRWNKLVFENLCWISRCINHWAGLNYLIRQSFQNCVLMIKTKMMPKRYLTQIYMATTTTIMMEKWINDSIMLYLSPTIQCRLNAVWRSFLTRSLYYERFIKTAFK